MAALVETMFYTREKPWHGLGVNVNEALNSEDALIAAGLNWSVIQKPVFTQDGVKIEGCYANIRDFDQSVLGVVTSRYKVVQNKEAFSFTDELLGKGVRYETAGSLKDGKRVWSTKHTGNIEAKMEDAKKTLFMAEHYMSELSKSAVELSKKQMSDAKVNEYIKLLLPIATDATEVTENNIIKLREDLKKRYFNAPDLKHVGKNGYRFINAVSDFATHSNPIRRTKNFKENIFQKTMDGNPMIDKAYELIYA